MVAISSKLRPTGAAAVLLAALVSVGLPSSYGENLRPGVGPQKPVTPCPLTEGGKVVDLNLESTDDAVSFSCTADSGAVPTLEPGGQMFSTNDQCTQPQSLTQVHAEARLATEPNKPQGPTTYTLALPRDGRQQKDVYYCCKPSRLSQPLTRINSVPAGNQELGEEEAEPEPKQNTCTVHVVVKPSASSEPEEELPSGDSENGHDDGSTDVSSRVVLCDPQEGESGSPRLVEAPLAAEKDSIEFSCGKHDNTTLTPLAKDNKFCVDQLCANQEPLEALWKGASLAGKSQGGGTVYTLKVPSDRTGDKHLYYECSVPTSLKARTLRNPEERAKCILKISVMAHAGAGAQPDESASTRSFISFSVVGGMLVIQYRYMLSLSR